MNVKNPTIRDAIAGIKGTIGDLYPKNEIQSFIYLIFDHLLGLSKVDLHLNRDKNITIRQFEQINMFTKQLKRFMPVQYVLGVTDFYGLQFRINKHVLIPRPETEELVDLVIQDNKYRQVDILDLGTGSGCIAISLAKFLKKSNVDAVDISKNAINLATENALAQEAKVGFIEGDIFSDNIKGLRDKYHIIVSNPPYITEKEKNMMDKNVLMYEPYQALFVPDSDPLMFYDRIAGFGKNYLFPEGLIYVEINEALGTQVKELFSGNGYTRVELFQDIHAKDRVIKACI